MANLSGGEESANYTMGLHDTVWPLHMRAGLYGHGLGHACERPSSLGGNFLGSRDQTDGAATESPHGPYSDIF